jgi:hypothetical protein
MTEALFGDLPPGDQTRLDDHLQACDACAAEFASLQSTLEVTAAYERPQRSDAYWDAFSERLYKRVEQEPAAAPADAAVPSWTDRLATWWASRPALLPVTGMQWAFHGALALLLIAAGLTLGRMTAPAPPPSDPLAEAAGPATDPLLVPITAGVKGANIEPRLTSVEDITYDVTAGTVEIRYNTTNDVVVRGEPDDPKIQRLLRAALLDDNNPSSRLHAVKTLEAARPAPDDEIISALTYLVRDESSPDMRLRAVRALRRLHQTAPMNESTRGVLVNMLLEADRPALRIEALEALTTDAMLSSSPAAPGAPRDTPTFLHQAQSDSNGYVRYRAGEMLQQIRSDAGDS